MPSQAFEEYLKNLKDVRRLAGAHKKANHTKPGRRGLGHFTRGGIVLLCAAWERYIESVVDESAAFFAAKLPNHTALPAHPRQKVIDYVNSTKNTWTHADLATTNWKTVYQEAVKQRTGALNTPKSAKLISIFNDFLGVTDISTAWTRGTTDIDAFVRLRCEVAHRGGQAKYIWIGQLEAAEETVSEYVTETDNFLSDYLRPLVTPKKRPWNRKN